MFADFFIKRPVFASVCSLVILLAGAIALPTLPVAQYPNIAPTTISVTANYPGADAETVEKTVTTILEKQINGVEGMQYMTSNSGNDGSSTINVLFPSDRDGDISNVNVQNRVSIGQPQLPQEVKNIGVTVQKKSTGIVFAMGLYTDKGEYDNTFLSNYADLYLVDSLKRLPGVGDIQIIGERKYAMRIWLDPNRLAGRGITSGDVVNALNEQNLQVGAGQLGQPPSPNGQMYQIDLRAKGRLTQPSEFEEMILKTGTDGTLVKLRDVGRAELGAENYTSFLRFSGKDSVGLLVFQLPGGNALDVAKEVKAEMAKLAQKFPPGMKWQVGFDTTLYVEESQREVVKTLFEAILLVVLVIFIFLQSWRTTLIPAITIPVSLIGTFAIMKVFGFSLNSLSLFGLTLATGLVVDDAIVVIENIERLIQERGLSPRQAASEAMGEVTGAVIATSLVLMAVFIPVAFFPGTTGQLYKQFALTIAFSIAISAFNALTLTPALSALLLRRSEGRKNWFFERFNWGFDKMRQGYQWSVTRLTRFKGIVILVFIATLGLTGWLYTQVPQAFLPDEDQGYIITIIQGPEGASLNYTSDVMTKVEKQLQQIPETRATFAIGGYNFNGGYTSNSGVVFTSFKPWGERTKAGQSATEIINNVRAAFAGIPEAKVLPINAPPIQGLSSFGGFQYELQDRGNSGLETLAQVRDNLVKEGNQNPNLKAVFSTYAINAPQYLIEVDRNKAKALQVSVQDVLDTLQTYLGSSYVNDFNLGIRSYRVYVQADAKFRSNPSDIGVLNVRSQTGQMIPLSNLVKLTPTAGEQTVYHYNLYRAIEINGGPAPGASSGQAIQAMQQLSARLLPPDMGYEWSGSSAQELESGGKAPFIFALGIVFVFLVLSAQYENYVDPLIILLSVPLAVLGAVLAQMLRGIPNDVYGQIGLVMLVGLSSKNAILIVEFANQNREKGMSITKAAVEAAQERLRPILMTAIAFILGIFPLVIAVGAGALSRQSLGTTVAGGMVVSTVLSLFVVPILYIVIETARDRFKPGHKNKETKNPEPSSEVKAPSTSR